VEPFRAQPATVLKKQPFVPAYKDHQPPKVEEFQLKTDARVVQRLKFEEKLQHNHEMEAKMLEKVRLI